MYIGMCTHIKRWENSLNYTETL